MPDNIGNQTITIKYHDPVESPIGNRIGLGVRKVGIYTGGYLTKVNDTTVTLSTFSCEISDGTYQIYGTTGSTVNITVAVATPYVCLRWIYTGSETADYIDFIVTNTPASNDIIVGKCIFAGSTLTGFDYSKRTNPLIMDLFLKVEPTSPTSMKVRIRAGKINYGTANYDIIDQESSAFSAPGTGSRIDVVYVDTDGTIKVFTGVAGGSPSAPDYNNKIVLAEITIASTDTEITASMIKDVRAFNTASLDKSGNQLGDWVSKLVNTVYQATTDGFVCAFTPNEQISASHLTGYSDSSNPPTTIRMEQSGRRNEAYFRVGIMFLVKKGNYWKVIQQYEQVTTVYWRPLGS